MTPRNKIIESIEEFVGEDKESTVADIVREVSAERKGYNQALQDLRSKAPQLADEILEVVVGEIQSSITRLTKEAGICQSLKSTDDALTQLVEDMPEIITSLTQDINSDNK